MKKADCTPEQWELYLEQARASYRRNRDVRVDAKKAYNRTPEALAKRRAYDMKPDVKARRQAREQEPGYQQRRWERIKSDPTLLDKKYAQVRRARTGICQSLFDALIELQNNSCAICDTQFEMPRKGHRKASGRSYPCADHCHDGGHPRGLLCHNCNTIEGHVRSRGIPMEEYMQRLNDYLQNPPAKQVKQL